MKSSKTYGRTLGAVMALSVCSFTAFAEDGMVAEIIGDKEYATLQEAVNAAKDGDTIKLLDKVSTSTLGSPIEKILHLILMVMI